MDKLEKWLIGFLIWFIGINFTLSTLINIFWYTPPVIYEILGFPGRYIVSLLTKIVASTGDGNLGLGIIAVGLAMFLAVTIGVLIIPLLIGLVFKQKFYWRIILVWIVLVASFYVVIVIVTPHQTRIYTNKIEKVLGFEIKNCTTTFQVKSIDCNIRLTGIKELESMGEEVNHIYLNLFDQDSKRISNFSLDDVEEDMQVTFKIDKYHELSSNYTIRVSFEVYSRNAHHSIGKSAQFTPNVN